LIVRSNDSFAELQRLVFGLNGAKQCGRVLGVGYDTVRHWKNGRNKIPPDIWNRMRDMALKHILLLRNLVDEMDYNGSHAMTSEPKTVSSSSDQRTVNNVMRHEYRPLTEGEKVDMKSIKDAGLAFHDLLTEIGGADVPESREIRLAKTKIEEAVMWAVKHLTK
jgi:hypothetical protein